MGQDSSSENSIELKPINNILAEKFFIPSYQRGYRWTKQQVTDLLDDIWEFSQKDKSKDEFYCLQPVVVKANKDGKWELIDGQQRLTTIHIILSFLNTEKKFSIEFETRTDSEDFLKKIDQLQKGNNIDYYHIWTALDVITGWFKNKEEEGVNYIKDKFRLTLIESVKVIWYQVNDGSDPIDIFTRINMGKIPLTNAELIKSLFLRSDNFGDDKDKIRLEQLRIAGEWDRIEYALQNDEFWYFLNDGSHDPATRIEFILDLMAVEINKGFDKDKEINKKQNDFFSFLVFNQYFEDKKQNNPNILIVVEEIWGDIENYFMTFEEWFQDRNFYHLVGYLITANEKIEELKEDSEGKTKSELKNHLENKIREKVNYDISGLEYENDKENIIKVLLLFNIKTLISNEKSNSRFPFDRYKKEKWSLEHIHAQNSDGLNTVNQWNIWIDEHIKSLERIDSKKYASLIAKLSESRTEKITKEIFDELFKEVMDSFKEEGQEDNMHGIQNLALLDKNSNSALNKSIFEVKRKLIIDREKKGSFIPICTRNVFLKYYTENASQLYFWGKEDRSNYLSSIEKTLKGYLPKQTEGGNNGDN